MEHSDLEKSNESMSKMNLSIEAVYNEPKGHHVSVKKYAFIALAVVSAFACAAVPAWGQYDTRGLSANIRTEKVASHRAVTDKHAIARVSEPPIRRSPMESPFEKAWPGYPLPSWARKKVNYEVPASERMCFVHVGKAGGSAVGCSLGFSLHCGDSEQEDGILPKIATAIFHKDMYNCEPHDTRFLFVIRDPIERARSAFNYDRPKVDPNGHGKPTKQRYIRYYKDCEFGTIEEMVQNGLSEHGHSSDYCSRLAFRAIRGLDWKSPSHLYYNYQYYFEGVPTNSSIFVIRNEHLTEDWNSLEEGLSGRTNIMAEDFLPKLNANTKTNEDDLYISDESLAILCQALCNEIHVYKNVLLQAENLDDAQVQESLDELKLKCPVEAMADECPEAMPDITKKLEENRGYSPEETTL